MAGEVNSAFSHAASTFSPASASRQASDEPGASAGALSTAKRCSRARRSELKSLDGERSKEAQAIAAPNIALRMTRPARQGRLGCARNNASMQNKNSNAAEPAATHKRNAEVPNSGSTPSINPPRYRPNAILPKRTMSQSHERLQPRVLLRPSAVQHARSLKDPADLSDRARAGFLSPRARRPRRCS